MKRAFAWTDAAVRRALGLDEAGGEERLFTGVSTDTRTIEDGNLFVALRGPRFDGHDLLAEAHARGARGAVVSRPSPAKDLLPLYPVRDTLVALGQLGRFRRRALDATVVAITGSTGKTTVKDLLAAGLGVAHRVHRTRANLNNRIGVPLTLLAAPDDAEFLVVELGTSEPGEIGALARISEPDLALVTTVGEAHLEGLASLEGVLEEKLALLRELRPGAPALVGDEPAELPGRARAIREDVAVAGFSGRAATELRGEPEPADDEGRVAFRFGGRRIRPSLPGEHGARNVLLALAGMEILGVGWGDAVPALERLGPTGLRGETRRIGGLTLILDCYNANPLSVRAGLAQLAACPPGGGRVAVLGSMLELGGRSDALHRELLEEALRGPFAAVVAVGEFEKAAEALGNAPAEDDAPSTPRLLVAPDAEGAWKRLADELQGDEVVLLEGSRGVALEWIVPRLEERFRSPAEGA